MEKLLRRLILGSLLTLLSVVYSNFLAGVADAQVTLKIGRKQSLTVTPGSSAEVKRQAILLLSSKASRGVSLVIGNTSKSTRRVASISLNGKQLKYAGTTVRRGRDYVVPLGRSNKKTAALTATLINLIMSMDPSATSSPTPDSSPTPTSSPTLGIEVPDNSSNTFDQSSAEVPTTFVTVYKKYSYTLCQSTEADLAAIDAELSRKGIRSISSYCAVGENQSTSTVCGGLAFGFRMHVIERSQLVKAVLSGFYPLDWLTSRVTVTECSPSIENQTVEMVGTISNVSCRTTQNTVEDFDRRLTAAGLNILDASCGFANFFTVPVCGEIETFYRSVRIRACQQRELALSLGLRDKKDYSFFAKFGQECPTPVIFDPPLGSVEMVGVISNTECSPPRNTVANFDRLLSDAKIPVLQSSCGYLKIQTQTPCPDVYRAVTIPSDQEIPAIILFGLFRKSNVEATVKFGQSCPL